MSNPNTPLLRGMVRGAYDLQTLRIQAGNRIVANFKTKIGQAPGESEDTLEDAPKEVLKILRENFKKLTDGVKKFPRRKDFKGNEIISSFAELTLIQNYLYLEEAEKQAMKHIEAEVKAHPLWDAYLKDVRGVAGALSGVLISEIDIAKARHPSSLWAYAGLDVVTKWHLQGTSITLGNLAKGIPTLNIPGLSSSDMQRISSGPSVARPREQVWQCKSAYALINYRAACATPWTSLGVSPMIVWS